MNGEGGTCESTVLFSHNDVTNGKNVNVLFYGKDTA